MSRQLSSRAAVASACLLMMTSVGFAQTRSYRQLSAIPPVASQQYASLAALVGTYHSSDFFPSPLTLTITGVDRYGNLSGSIRGMRSYHPDGEVDWRWENWGHDFGRDGSRAFYRDGKVNIVFPNGATYALDSKGNVLSGTFVADKENRAMTFIKAQGLASGR